METTNLNIKRKLLEILCNIAKTFKSAIKT